MATPIHQHPMHSEEDESNINDEIKELKSKSTNKPLPFHKLLSYADAFDWTLMALGTLGSVVHGMAQPIGYLLLGKALNAFGDNINDTDAMVKALYKVIPFVWYMAIATFPAGILEIGCWMYTSERQLARLRLAFFRAVLSQEIGAFDTDLTTGKIIAGMTSHMNIIQDAIGEKLGHFLSSFATFFAGILIAFLCCWQVALLTLLVVPMIFVIGATYTKKMNNISTIRLVYLSESTSMVEQTISQIKTVFAFVGESSAIKSFTDCMENQFKLSRREAFIKGVGMGMLQAVTFCSWALMVWIGAIVVAAKKSSGGDTIAAVMSILFGAISLTYAAPDMQIFNQAKAAGSEVFQVLQRKPIINSEVKGTTLGKINGNIDIRDVFFAYPSRDDKLILQGLSLYIPAGKVVALVGSSGCGKSTVISLVQRFYDPPRGEVLIDGHNIKDLNLKFLRRNIGVVSQEPSLFAGTIKDNLKVGNMSATDEQIERVAIMANMHSFISQLPNQYSTEVGERGVQLSGGQKQRIAIARAILKDPPILLLDEATSALDSESEKLVQDALEKAMQGRTVILIAHRLSTIIGADMIAVVENGRVAEIGTHNELLYASKFYDNLFNMQNLSTEPDSRNVVPADEPVNTGQKLSAQDFNQAEEYDEESMHLIDPLKQEKIKRRKQLLFFRIWFGLNKIELAKTAIGSVAASLSGISKPVFGFFIITIGVAYYKQDAKKKVGLYSMIFCLIGLLSLVTHTLQHYFYGVVGEKAMTNLRKALYSAILRNEIAWFEKPSSSVGALTSQIINDTSTIKTIISDRISVIVQCIASILIATTVSMIVNWRMGLVAWAVMPCHFIGGLIQAKSAKGFASDSSAAHQELVALASESTTNIKTIASFTHEEHILEKAKLSLEKPLRKSRIQSVKYGLIQGFSICLWNIAHAVALWYTTVLVDRKQASFENGIRSYQIFSLTVPSITELWMVIPNVIATIRVLTPVFQTLDRETEIEPDIPETSDTKKIRGRIEFEEVSFNYPLRPEVTILKKFSLLVEPGLKIALVGPSGAGKSSVLALLLRFYDPREGRILIDGTDIREFNLRWLRSQIGLVQQEPLLFSSSIRENICYGNEVVSEYEIIEVSIATNIHDFISTLPHGYDTVVGERGCQLSGGQKQRIAIARSLLKRPSILLLDEATSALDAETERVVMDAFGLMKAKQFSQLQSNTTQITVAHRLSTVKNADMIVVMDKGEVVEMGSHSTLIAATEGVYSRLVRLQSLIDKN
ncbi:ABC transporter [Macleaya cordata]|uniref:ABC transporter n=1 Tax=Macleaya cordata TaxID=56857 RepID=A0A200QFV1_MACCD|nr:ABC transporter [Macleaya cordata]